MILVTGAFGCLGSNLVRTLVEQGERVVALRQEDESAAELADLADHFEERVADVRSPEHVESAMRGVEQVYHLAGMAMLSNTVAERMHEVNVLGTDNVMCASARRDCRVVHVSSISAIGVPPDDVPVDERFEFNGERYGHAYMLTKHAGEQVVARHVEKGLDAVVLNPAAVMAPGGDGASAWPSFVVSVHRGKFRWCPRGGLAMTTREELVDAALRAMSWGVRGERYIVNTENLTYRELLAMVCRSLGRPFDGASAPDVVVGALARILGATRRFVPDVRRHPVLVPENLPYLVKTMYFDATKSRTELGVRETSLASAIDEVVTWCRERGHIG